MEKLGLQGQAEFLVLALPVPKRLHPLKKSGINVPVDLEMYYSDEVWQLAKEKGWLKEVDDPSSVLTQPLIAGLVKGDGNPLDQLSDSDRLRILFRFDDDRKERAVRMIETQGETRAKESLKAFEPLIEDLVAHLLPS